MGLLLWKRWSPPTSGDGLDLNNAFVRTYSEYHFPVDHLVSICLFLLHPQLKYRKDQKKMRGTSHYTSLTSEDNLALKNARKISKLVSEVQKPGVHGVQDLE